MGIVRSENDLDKASEMGHTSAVGSFQLFLGKMLSTILLAVGTIIVGIFILPTAYGLYTIAAIPASTFLLFQDWGVGAAMTRFCAQRRAENKESDLPKIIVTGMTFEVATGLFLTVISLVMASFVASAVFGKPASAFLIAIISVTILSAAFSAAAQTVFVGFEQMKLSSYTMICQAVVQSTLSALLVYLGYGAEGAALGYTIGSVVSSVTAAFLLYFVIFRRLGSQFAFKSDLLQQLKPMLKYGVPLAIAAITAGILTQFYSFMMAIFCSTSIIGNYGIATNFTVLPTFFTIPIATVMFPVFSKINPEKERKLLKTVFASSAKYAAFLLIPATLAIIVLSKPIIGTLFGNKWSYAPPLLALSVITFLFAVFGNISINSLIPALGETKFYMKLNLLTISIGIPIALILIPTLGIIGVILSALFDGIPSIFISVYWAWKKYGTVIDIKSSVKILLTSLIAAMITYLFLYFLNTAYLIQLVGGLVLFCGVYLTTTPLSGAISREDIKNLRNIFSSLGIISKILDIPLTLMEKISKSQTPSSNSELVQQ